MSHLVGNPEERFSRVVAQLSLDIICQILHTPHNEYYVECIILCCRPGLILIVNHDYFYSIEFFFNQKLFCNRRFLRLKLILFLFEYFSKMPVIVINFTNKFRLHLKTDYI